MTTWAVINHEILYMTTHFYLKKYSVTNKVLKKRVN